MNNPFPNTQTRPKFLAIVLVALAGFMMIYSLVNISNRHSLPSRFEQTIQLNTHLYPGIPAPQPVPTPPATRSQATTLLASPVFAQQTPAATPLPQPVPTPPVDH